MQQRSFQQLSQPPPSLQSNLLASISGREYLRQHVAVRRHPVRSVRVVLRTRHAHVDRRTVRVALQLRDAFGNVDILTTGLKLTMVVASSPPEKTQRKRCTTANLAAARSHHLGSCLLSALPKAWFDTPGTATVRIEAQYGSAVVAIGEAGQELTLHGKPSWFDRRDEVLVSAGAFAALPVSPVRASEDFPVEIYAHTGGHQLETWWIELHIDSTLLEFVAFSQSRFFNGVVFSEGGSSASILRFQAVGTKASASPEQVHGAKSMLTLACVSAALLLLARLSIIAWRSLVRAGQRLCRVSPACHSSLQARGGCHCVQPRAAPHHHSAVHQSWIVPIR